MLFQSELGWSVLGSLGRSTDSVRRAPLRKQKTKRSAGIRSLPFRCLSQFFPVEEKINYLGNEVLCVSPRTFYRWDDLVFIMDDCDNFSS